MTKKIFLVAVLLSVGFCECGQTVSSNSDDKKRVDTSVSEKTFSRNDGKRIGDTIPDFIKISNDEKTEGYLGNLVGVATNDSSGPYVIREYISDTLSFDLIFYPKSGNKASITFDSVRNDAANDYSNYVCFAFVYPMKDPSKMKNYHDDNVTYPVSAKCYVRKSRHWTVLSTAIAYNLSALSKFKIKCIYKGIK